MAGLKFWRAETDDARVGTAVQPFAATPSEPTLSADDAAALLRVHEDAERGWFWSTDAQGRLSYLTPTLAARIAGPGETPIGRDFAELFGLADQAAGSVRTLPYILARQSKIERAVVVAARPQDERPCWWALSGTPQTDANGVFAGYRGSGIDITEERLSSRSVSQLALTDTLTGLPNRLRATQVLEAGLNGIEHHKRPCAVMLMDLDRFKAVNDTLGHPAGDALLRQVADRLTRLLGDGEKIFRLGGDEFQIVLRDTADREALARIADDIIAMVSQPYVIDGHRCIIGASLGIAIAPTDGQNADQLIRNADLALYAVKESGRGRFHFFEIELLESAENRRQLESDLRDALAKGEFVLAYQPIVCASTNRPAGVETLIRWHHPVHGLVSPAVFIPVAEEASLIDPLGEWILRKACADAAAWPGELRIAVNVSPIQFANEAFPEIVMSALAASGLPPERLELEITESVFLGESAATDTMFATLKRIGVRLSLDDFGTGYSSLGYLKSAPFDKIKIDQSFVREATLPGSRNAAIIAAIVALAGALDMETTAEGIESFDQLQLCRDLGVSHIQGYIYSPGVDDATLIANIADGNWTIEPKGPAKQRATRQSIFRKVGAIWGNCHKSVIVRNISATGAAIEGLPELPLETLMLLDFGDGEIALASVRRAGRGQIGVEFGEQLVADGHGGFRVAQRASPYMLATLGLSGNYGDALTTLDPLRAGTLDLLAERLGLRGFGSGLGAAGERAAMTAMSLNTGKVGSHPGLARDDVVRLVEAARSSANPQLRNVVELLIHTGVRQRELMEARWEHVDLDGGVWHVPDAASRKPRTVRLTAPATALIRALPRFEGCPHLIVNPGTRQPYRSFASSWDTARRKAKLPAVELDELRHGSAAAIKGLE